MQHNVSYRKIAELKAFIDLNSDIHYNTRTHALHITYVFVNVLDNYLTQIYTESDRNSDIYVLR